MITLLDYILDLFGDESHAQAFVVDPDRALADAGLSRVSSAQLQSVAATAVPSLAMGGSRDPISDLQQAVSSRFLTSRRRPTSPPAPIWRATTAS
jgi:hypothetical protein